MIRRGRSRTWPSLCVAVLAAAIPAPLPSAAPPAADAVIRSSGNADRLIAEGRYPAAAAAARTTLEKLRLGGRGKSEDAARAWLSLAAANELEEGSADATRDFLAEAAKAIPRPSSDPLLPIRVEELRALALARAGEGPAGAEALLRARAALNAVRPPPPALEQLRLQDSYGLILLRLGLYREALNEFIAAFEGRDAALPAGHPDILASLHHLGEARMRLGDLAGAEETFREVARVRRLALGEAHPQTLASRAMLAAIWESKGLRQEALAERKALLAATEVRDGRKGAAAARALLAFSQSQASLGQRDEALATASEAFELSLAAEPRNPAAIAEAGAHLAKALYDSGAFSDSIAIVQKAAQASTLPDRNISVIDLQITRAAAYAKLGRYGEAEPIYRHLISIYDADPLLNRDGHVTVLNNYAVLLASIGRLGQALSIQRQVVDLRTRTLGADDPRTLTAMSSLASYLVNTGQVEAGVAMHRRVLEKREAASPQDPLAIASSLHNLSSAVETEGNLPQAIALLKRAMEIRARILGERHFDTLGSTRQLAGMYLSAGEYSSSAALYKRLVALVEDIRLTVAATEAGRRDYFRTVVDTYKGLAIIQAQTGNGLSAFDYADAARARTLSDQIGAKDLARRLLPADEALRVAQAEGVLARLAVVDVAPMGSEEQERHAARVDAAAAGLAEIRRGLEARYPQLRFAAKAESLRLPDVRAAVPANGAFIQFVVLGDKIQILWLTSDGAGGVSALLTAPGLRETVRAYLAVLSEPAMNAAPGTAAAERRVFAWPDGSFRLLPLTADIPDGAEIVGDSAPIRTALSKLLIEALPERIRARPRWIISPDSFLAALPFDSLELDGKLLVETRRISYAPSFRTLILLNAREAAYRKLDRAPLLVVGDPAYQSAGDGSPARSWQELAGSGLEVQAMMTEFKLEPERSVFSRLKASERTVRDLDSQQRLTRFRTLLFSTHGIIDVGTPERNAIVLVGDGAALPGDGYLTAAEISGLTLRSDLVVVSACESGVGEWLDGEGAMGLPYALFVAGTASAVLSHWPIADRGSAAFMTRFFRKMKAGAGPAEALQQTKLDFRNGLEGERWRDPAYWAAFSLYGSPA